MREFIDLVQQLFPSIDPETATNTYKAIERELKGKDRSQLEFVRTETLKEPSQGDLFSNLTLPFVDETGDLAAFEDSVAMLLTCGCDFDRDEYVKFAAVHPLSVFLEMGFKESDIKNQTITGLMYIPMFEHSETQFVVDFSQVSSISTDLIRKLMDQGKTERIGSLNDFGYHFLLAKLTVHLLRPEDSESKVERAS